MPRLLVPVERQRPVSLALGFSIEGNAIGIVDEATADGVCDHGRSDSVALCMAWRRDCVGIRPENV